MTVHSCVLAPHLKPALAAGAGGKYGRMFPGLPRLDSDEQSVLALGRSGSRMDGGIELDRAGAASDNPRIAAGFTYFGHFLAHDLTADRSLLQHHASPDELQNFRTPRLDLESLYAAGPSGSPYMYDAEDGDKFLVGVDDSGAPVDVPRNRQGRAIIGDARDDVHRIISQLHLVLLRFHNRVVDWVRANGTPSGMVFQTTQQTVRRHYQWIVVNEFLPLVAGDALVDEVRARGPWWLDGAAQPFIPVEFADAAYRFGHSQVRPSYLLNASGVGGAMFPDLAGGRPVPAGGTIDWRFFFAIDPSVTPQASKRIDTRFAHSLIDLPEAIVGATETDDQRSLACRDLERAYALDLPSGETIARAIGAEPLTVDECGLHETGWIGETPLGYYVLKEAEQRAEGRHLGPVGGRIVADVLLGLLVADDDSYLAAQPDWRPTLPAATQGRFGMTDLITFANSGGAP